MHKIHKETKGFLRTLLKHIAEKGGDDTGTKYSLNEITREMDRRATRSLNNPNKVKS